MSSILKALKKLETETTEKEAAQFVWPQPVDTKATFNSKLQDRFSKKFLTYKVALGFFCSTTLALLIFISYSTYHESKTALSVSAFTADKNETRDINRGNKTEKRAKQEVASNWAEKGGGNADIEMIETRSTAELPKENTDKALNDSLADSVSLTENQNTAAVFTAPEKRTAPGWLTLQGISWSATPSKRMAVINSTIAREGKTVDGGRIVRIDKTYVVVEKNGESLRLTFD